MRPAVFSFPRSQDRLGAQQPPRPVPPVRRKLVQERSAHLSYARSPLRSQDSALYTVQHRSARLGTAPLGSRCWNGSKTGCGSAGLSKWPLCNILWPHRNCRLSTLHFPTFSVRQPSYTFPYLKRSGIVNANSLGFLYMGIFILRAGGL